MSQPRLRNVTEEIVYGLVKFFLNGAEYQTFCNCGQCELEITAAALNQLPCYYVTSDEEREKAFQILNTPENISKMNKAIIHAIYTVGKKPNHS